MASGCSLVVAEGLYYRHQRQPGTVEVPQAYPQILGIEFGKALVCRLDEWAATGERPIHSEYRYMSLGMNILHS